RQLGATFLPLPAFAIVLPPNAASQAGAANQAQRERNAMKHWSALTAVALFAGLAALTSSHQAARQAAQAWIALFGGKEPDHLAPIGDANWRIEDGVLCADKASKNSYLVSKDDYSDFQIRAEFWVSDDANSGIFVRCTSPNEVAGKNAYEVNIFDTRPDPSYGTGAIVDTAKAATVAKAVDKGNTSAIPGKSRGSDV